MTEEFTADKTAEKGLSKKQREALESLRENGCVYLNRQLSRPIYNTYHSLVVRGLATEAVTYGYHGITFYEA